MKIELKKHVLELSGKPVMFPNEGELVPAVVTALAREFGLVSQEDWERIERAVNGVQVRAHKITVEEILLAAIDRSFSGAESPDLKANLDLYSVGKKISQAGDVVELTPGEATRLRDRVAKLGFGPLITGRICEELEDAQEDGESTTGCGEG